MDIYITGNLPKSQTDKGTSVKLRLSALPEEIDVKIEQRFATYDIIGLGPVQVPSGEELTLIGWTGMLFGAGRKNAPWIRSWTDPEVVLSYFNTWKKYNVKLKLLISGKNINQYVYLESLEYKATGGFGDYEYTISFVEAKNLSVSVTKKKATTTTAKKTTAKSTTAKRTSKTKTKTYTVKKGDTLWGIAVKYYKKGSQWTKIYNKNKNTIEKAAKKHGKKSSNKGHWIYPGTKLTIP